MNLDEKAPSLQPSPAEREREKGRQREANAAKLRPVHGRFASCTPPPIGDSLNIKNGTRPAIHQPQLVLSF